jgi:shikimate kinase
MNINKLEKPVSLIGMSGVGKSYQAEKLRDRYGFSFFDIDADIINKMTP